MSYEARTLERSDRTSGSSRERPIRTSTRRVKPSPTFRQMARGVVSTSIQTTLLLVLGFVFAVWLQSGGITGIHDGTTLLMSLGRLTGLLGAYALLLQLLLLARLPFFEFVASWDKLTAWHRVNGKLTLYLILAHVLAITAGYALTDKLSFPAEFFTLFRSYTGIWEATIGTALLVLVVVTSFVIVRKQLRYQTWFLVHLMAYSAVVLGWFHQIPTGLVFFGHPLAAALWTAMYVVTLELIVLFRVAQPILRNLWYRLRVAEVIREGPGVVSLHITGPRVGWLHARAGQFFLWRFLDEYRWHEAHPFSLSAAPDGRSLRLTAKALGDFTGTLAQVRPGTRVVVEGPFGGFTNEARVRDKALLVAGGIGITPIRALLEEMEGDLVLLYRVNHEDELVFRTELDDLARRRSIRVEYIIGDYRDPAFRDSLSSRHLRRLVPDVARREIYVCGPSAMMQVVAKSAQKSGVTPERIHFDAFSY